MIIEYTRNLAISILIITAIIFSSLSSIGNYTSIFNKNDHENFKGSISIITAPSQVCAYIQNGLSSMENCYFNETDNIVVTNTTANESYPTMVVSGYNALVAYENKQVNNTHVYLRNSINYGQNWSSGYVSINPQKNTFSPSLCIKPFSKNAYCAAVSDHNKSGVLYDIEIPNIDNLNNIKVYSLDWSTYKFYNFSKPDIVYNSDTKYPDVPFMTIVIGSTNFEDGKCKNTPMFFYRTPNDPTQSTIAWDATIQNCNNISMSFDNVKKIFYGVCEIKNQTKTNIFLFYDNPLTWSPNSTIKYKILKGDENLTHPQIFFTQNQIFITAETETNGIIIYNSTDGYKTYETHNVTRDIIPNYAKSKYPILYANQDNVYCIFTESGNISITNSSDNGSTWSTAVQLNNFNGSVVENYRFSDIPDKDHIIWTDNREGNNDIYSVLITLPQIDIMVVPDSIKINLGEYPILPTKNWINFTVKNNGNAYVEDVTVEINYTCKNKTRSTNFPAYILYLDGNGAEKTFYKPLFRMILKEFISALMNFAGIQNITITVDPYKIYNDSNPDDNSATIEVSYADIFPNLYFLENIFAG